MYCQKCGTENPDEALYCRNCGQFIVEKKDTIQCSHCKTTNEFDTVFCKKCGQKLNENEKEKSKRKLDSVDIYQERENDYLPNIFILFAFFCFISILFFVVEIFFIGIIFAIGALIASYFFIRFLNSVGENISLKNNEILLMLRRGRPNVFLTNKRLVILQGKKYIKNLNLRTDIDSILLLKNVWGKEVGVIFNIYGNEQFKIKFNDPIRWYDKIVEIWGTN